MILLLFSFLILLLLLYRAMIRRYFKPDQQQIAITDDHYRKFDSFLPQIIHEFSTFRDERFPEVADRIEDVLNYNLVNGKKFRAMTLVKCFHSFMEVDAITLELQRVSYALGWLSEMFHTSCLIYDDIMDNSLSRRGKQCWYLHRNNGTKAINDGSTMRFLGLITLKNFCYGHQCYLQIFELYMTASKLTMFGQIMDCLTTPEGGRPNYSLLNETRYETIVAYKTSYYTFVLPIRVAMYLAKITDKDMHSEIEKVLLRIGYLFQAQDDYLDIYGNPKVTGKIGTDIEDGKCSWIAVKAYRMMNEKMKKIFEDNYGRKERVHVIKHLFETLQMKTVFRAFEAKEHVEIQTSVSSFETKHNIRIAAVRDVSRMLLKRKK